MKSRLMIGNLQMWCGVRWMHKTLGVNSKLPDGRHILMWDFDGADEDAVRSVLTYVQDVYSLGDIVIASSGRDGHYHAVCLQPHHVASATLILMDTPYVDYKWVGIGLYRGYWTLRFSARKGEQMSDGIVLPGDPNAERVPITALSNFSEYWSSKG